MRFYRLPRWFILKLKRCCKLGHWIVQKPHFQSFPLKSQPNGISLSGKTSAWRRPEVWSSACVLPAVVITWRDSQSWGHDWTCVLWVNIQQHVWQQRDVTSSLPTLEILRWFCGHQQWSMNPQWISQCTFLTNDIMLEPMTLIIIFHLHPFYETLVKLQNKHLNNVFLKKFACELLWPLFPFRGHR